MALTKEELDVAIVAAEKYPVKRGWSYAVIDGRGIESIDRVIVEAIAGKEGLL